MYTRQFILRSASLCDYHESWKKINVGNDLVLAVHPALNSLVREGHDKQVILLGYVLDPRNPEHADADILDHLLSRSNTPEDIITGTTPLCGRWVMIIATDTSLILFQDPGALRTVYYYFCGNTVSCASQPGLIRDLLQLPYDVSAREYSLGERFANTEDWWPGDSCPFLGVKRLLPNHYLDLMSKKTVRFWPRKTHKETTCENAQTPGFELKLHQTDNKSTEGKSE